MLNKRFHPGDCKHLRLIVCSTNVDTAMFTSVSWTHCSPSPHCSPHCSGPQLCCWQTSQQQQQQCSVSPVFAGASNIKQLQAGDKLRTNFNGGCLWALRCFLGCKHQLGAAEQGCKYLAVHHFQNRDEYWRDWRLGEIAEIWIRITRSKSFIVHFRWEKSLFSIVKYLLQSPPSYYTLHVLQVASLEFHIWLHIIFL